MSNANWLELVKLLSETQTKIFKILKNDIEGFESKLKRVRDDRELLNVALQESLQKQQATIQAMSSIIKIMHDTNRSIIRNSGNV